MGDIRSGNGDPDKWDRQKALDHVPKEPVVTATQQMAADRGMDGRYADLFSHDLHVRINKMLMDNLMGRWTVYENAYFVFDKRTKDYEDCTSLEEAKGCVEGWLEQGAKMEDIVVYAVRSKLEVKPSPAFTLVETDDGTDD